MRPTSTSLLGLLSAPTGYRQGRCDANQRSGVVSPRWICVSRGRSDMHAFLSFYVTSRSTIIVNCSSCRTVPLALNPGFVAVCSRASSSIFSYFFGKGVSVTGRWAAASLCFSVTATATTRTSAAHRNLRATTPTGQCAPNHHRLGVSSAPAPGPGCRPKGIRSSACPGSPAPRRIIALVPCKCYTSKQR